MDTLKEKEIEEILIKNNLSFDNLKYLAREVSENSWSPYSNFPIGAVVVGIDQNKKVKVFSGTNVEPTVCLTLCAERVALYNAISSGFKKFIAIAVSLPKANVGLENTNDSIHKLTPCGACREVIAEKLESKGIILIDGLDRTFTPRELLPHPTLEMGKLKTLSIEELDTLDSARKALHNAVVPYSREKFGVAVLVEGGEEIFSSTSLDSTSFGCSVEPIKSVFGLIAAKGLIKNKIKCIAFAYPFVKYPSGDALQLISDYTDQNTKILIDNMGVSNINELLPWAFKL